jgi:subtilisin family serine protease
MSALSLVKLDRLMRLTPGNPAIRIGLIDGPVETQHADLAGLQLLDISEGNRAACGQTSSAACRHGTFVAGMLAARPGAPAPAICPECTLVIRPIFIEGASDNDQMPSARPWELAAAISKCIAAGARVINLSLALSCPSMRDDRALVEALNHAARRGVILVAAAGNQGSMGTSTITRHPWVIPVVGCDLQGRPVGESNFGASLGKRGLRAPGANVTSLGPEGQPQTLSGTSVAAPFVTGAVALLWSLFPGATAEQVHIAVRQAAMPRRHSVIPPLLDAMAAYDQLSATYAERRTA